LSACPPARTPTTEHNAPTQSTNLLLLLRLAPKPPAVAAAKVSFQGLRAASPTSSTRACRSHVAAPGATRYRCSLSPLCALHRALCRPSSIPRWHCRCEVGQAGQSGKSMISHCPLAARHATNSRRGRQHAGSLGYGIIGGNMNGLKMPPWVE
jgi:hypothetical protein